LNRWHRIEFDERYLVGRFRARATRFSLALSDALKLSPLDRRYRGKIKSAIERR
jgi:hypothetical protein